MREATEKEKRMIIETKIDQLELALQLMEDTNGWDGRNMAVCLAKAIEPELSKYPDLKEYYEFIENRYLGERRKKVLLLRLTELEKTYHLMQQTEEENLRQECETPIGTNKAAVLEHTIKKALKHLPILKERYEAIQKKHQNIRKYIIDF